MNDECGFRILGVTFQSTIIKDSFYNPKQLLQPLITDWLKGHPKNLAPTPALRGLELPHALDVSWGIARF